MEPYSVLLPAQAASRKSTRGQSQQVARMVDVLGGALSGHLAELPQEVGSFNSFRWCSNSTVDLSLTACLPT